MYKFIKLEKKGSISVLTISRESALNALNDDILNELEERIHEASNDQEVRALVLTGAGRSFVAGADIEVQSVFDIAEGLRWSKKGSNIFRKLELLDIPTIAAVNGFALGGGCELALACDMIVAGEMAKFGQPEVTLGITPGFSGTQRLPRRVGISIAKELIFTGRMISAEEAYRIGLANRVVSQENLMDETISLAEACIKNAPIALKYSKISIDRGMQTCIDSAISIENNLFAQCYGTQDQKEGMRAFIEKRKPIFLNK